MLFILIFNYTRDHSVDGYIELKINTFYFPLFPFYFAFHIRQGHWSMIFMIWNGWQTGTSLLIDSAVCVFLAHPHWKLLFYYCTDEEWEGVSVDWHCWLHPEVANNIGKCISDFRCFMAAAHFFLSSSYVSDILDLIPPFFLLCMSVCLCLSIHKGLFWVYDPKLGIMNH